MWELTIEDFRLKIENLLASRRAFNPLHPCHPQRGRMPEEKLRRLGGVEAACGNPERSEGAPPQQRRGVLMGSHSSFFILHSSFFILHSSMFNLQSTILNLFQRLNNLAQHVWLVRRPLQVRIHLSPVIVERVGFEILCVFHQQLHRTARRLGRLQRIAPHFR